MNNNLKKPVHVALLKPTHLEKLRKDGQLPERAHTLGTPDPQPLPKADTTKVSYRIPVIKGTDITAKAALRTKLRVIHEHTTPIPKDKIPPCNTCKTSACCTAFLVPLTKEEHESGIYGDYSVKFTDKELEQFQGRISTLSSIRAPIRTLSGESGAVYYLEGAMGERCPFLQEDNQCGIYDKRPITCRVYTCVDDARITQEMRDGTVDITEASLKWVTDLTSPPVQDDNVK